jgi:hypothetical protein
LTLPIEITRYLTLAGDAIREGDDCLIRGKAEAGGGRIGMHNQDISSCCST